MNLVICKSQSSSFEGMKGSRREAEVGHCVARLDSLKKEGIVDHTASVAIEAPKLKGLWREIHVAGLGHLKSVPRGY